MKTEHLEYFIDIAVSGSLSKTAERFFTSHQMIRKSIKSLENELNVKLIATSNQGSSLTEAGERFLQYAQAVCQLTDDLQTELIPFTLVKKKCEKKIIEFYVTPYLTDNMVLNFVDEYQNSNSKVVIELQSLPITNIYQQLTKPYAVSLIPTIEEAILDEKFRRDLQDNGLDYFLLAKRALYICTYVKTEWAKKDFYTLAEFEKTPLLISSNSTLNTNFIYNKNQQLVNSLNAQKNLLKKGTGITIVTQKEFEFYYPNDGKYLTIPTELQPIWYICLYPQGISLPEYVQDFLKHLEKIL